MNTLSKTLLALALNSLSLSGFAGDQGPVKDAHLLQVAVSDLKPGFEFSASALYFQPQADNLGWGVITTVLPIPSPNWSVVTFDPDFQFGFNLGARYILNNPGTDLQLSWSHLRTDDNDLVEVNPVSQWISPFSQTGTPPTMDAITGVAQLKVANASLNFNYDAVNLDIGKSIDIGTNLQTRFFTGLSTVYIKEEIISTFRGSPLPILSLNNTSTYKGVGARLGLNNNYHVYRGLNLVGQFASSILFGKMQPAQYQFTGTSAALILVGIDVNHEGLANPSVNQLVPALDAKLGLSYSFPVLQDSEFSLEAGYMGALYFNPLSSYETNNNVIALDTGSLSTASAKHTQSNFSVGGPYVTARFHC